jgi:hypothetical protein
MKCTTAFHRCQPVATAHVNGPATRFVPRVPPECLSWEKRNSNTMRYQQLSESPTRNLHSCNTQPEQHCSQIVRQHPPRVDETLVIKLSATTCEARLCQILIKWGWFWKRIQRDAQPPHTDVCCRCLKIATGVMSVGVMMDC